MTDKTQNNQEESKPLPKRGKVKLPLHENKKWQKDKEIEAKKIKLFEGRPSKYDPSVIPKRLEIAVRGGSMAAICAEFMIPRTTLYRWAEEHGEFRECLDLCKELMQNFMENQAVAHSVETKDGPKLNTTLWNFRSRYLFKDYRDQSPSIVINTNKEPDSPELASEIKDKLSELESKIRDKR